MPLAYLWVATATGGELMLQESPVVAVTDRGLAFGDGLFETVRVQNGKPLFLSRHLARLTNGLSVLSLTTPRWQIDLAAGRVIAANHVTDGVLKIMVTRGPGGRGYDIPAQAEPRLIIQTSPLPAGIDAPLTAVRAPWAVHSRSPLCQIKSMSALDKVLGKQFARAHQAHECIFINERGEFVESASHNLFVVRNGELQTPSLASGALPGIARQLLLEAAGLPVAITETALLPNAMHEAQEAFLTNMVGGVCPLVMFEGAPIGNGKVGEITKAAQKYFAARCLAEAQ